MSNNSSSNSNSSTWIVDVFACTACALLTLFSSLSWGGGGNSPVAPKRKRQPQRSVETVFLLRPVHILRVRRTSPDPNGAGSSPHAGRVHPTKRRVCRSRADPEHQNTRRAAPPTRPATGGTDGRRLSDPPPLRRRRLPPTGTHREGGSSSSANPCPASAASPAPPPPATSAGSSRPPGRLRASEARLMHVSLVLLLARRLRFAVAGPPQTGDATKFLPQRRYLTSWPPQRCTGRGSR